MRSTCFRFLSLGVFLMAGTLSPAFGDSSESAGRGVARLSLIGGDVSIRRGISNDLVAAAANGPLVVEDRVYTGANSRAEIQFDSANFVRVAENSEIRLSELETTRYQIQLAAGLVSLSVLRDSSADLELSTPSVSVRPLKKGSYRISVGGNGETDVTVRGGEVEVYTPTGTEKLKSGQTMRVRGPASQPEFQISGAPGKDDWDRWNHSRDQELQRSTGYQYASRDIYGIEDLDTWGEWADVPAYGWSWIPRVTVGWAPYRYGRWTWMDWYGWTWVSYDPWGWAPYHYGRWFWYAGRGWCWYPGGVRMRHHWSPALVGFFGFGPGRGGGIGLGTVGWFPLGPRDPFNRWWGRKVYGAYRSHVLYDGRVFLNNDPNWRRRYSNASVENAITGLDGRDFTRGRGGASLRMTDHDWNRTSVVRGALPLTPERESLRMVDRTVAVPIRHSDDRSFYTRRTPNVPERVSFDDQRAAVERLSRRAAEFQTRTEGTGWRPAEEQVVRPDHTERARVIGAESPHETVPGSRTTPAADSNRAYQPGRESRDSGWRTFGEPANRATPERSIDSRDTARGWRGFGDPGSRNDSTTETRPTAPVGSGDATIEQWRRLDGRSSDSVRGAARTDTSRDSWPDRGRQTEASRQSIQVSPRIVRERSERWGGSGGGRSMERSMPAGSDRGGRMSSPGGSTNRGGPSGSRGGSEGSRGGSGGSRGGGGRGR